jgi:hypothetical protein
MRVVYICVVPEIKDLLQTQDGEIAQTEVLVENLSEQLSRAKGALTQLLIEKRSLESVARRYGLDIPPTRDTPVSDWTKMSRTDAVERLLGEAPGATWHLSEIETALCARGRDGDTTPLISATLVHLRRSRGSVKSVGNGVWKYVTDDDRARIYIGTDVDPRDGTKLPRPADSEGT